MKQINRILAIETSCDETAASIVEFDMESMRIKPLSSVVASQIDIHKIYGGVYPELASRAHSQKIAPIVQEALALAQVESVKCKVKSGNSHLSPVTCHLSLAEIDAIAVTVGPGLVGSLIVGVEFARGLSASLNLPVIPINHLEGHIYANFIGISTNNQVTSSKQSSITNNQKFDKLNINKLDIVCDLAFGACDLPPKPAFPLLALVVSGGHTLLVLMKKHLDYKIIGTTLDDAAGECFDKVARMLGLPYPGGPEISKLAEKGNPKAFDFPRSMLNSGDYNFSFSGLKTAVFYKLRSLGLVNNRAEPVDSARVKSGPPDSMSVEAGKCKVTSAKNHLSPVHLSPDTKADLAASVQAAIVDVLVAKTLRAATDFKVKSILVGGGVAANSSLRAEFAKLKVKNKKYKVYLSPISLATDNALSIAAAACYRLKNGDATSWHNLEVNASLRL